MTTTKNIIKAIALLLIVIFVFQVIAPIAIYGATESLTTGYEIRNNTIMRILKGTTVTQFLSNITVNSGAAKAVYKGNTVVTGDTKLATGMTFKTGDNTTYNIAVRCDANGDGELTAVDLSQVKLHLTGLNVLKSPNVEAIDINYDGQITAVDLSQIKMLLVGLEVPRKTI